MKVSLIAYTDFKADTAEELTGWRTDATGGQALVEFAGRACYQSWDKPNPATATNKTYIHNIIDHEHFSVLEHASATFYFTGVSRSFTHELIRHRHLSYSELSQRFVDASTVETVTPPLYQRGDRTALPVSEMLLNEHMSESQRVYNRLVSAWDGALREDGTTVTRKQAREAARAVLPNATETRIVVTGNMRAWRHFIAMRATEHADAEMRTAAVVIAWELKMNFPNLFQDMHLKVSDKGDVIYFGEPRD